MGTKSDRNQHTMGTLGESETGEAWDWRLTDSQPLMAASGGMNCAHIPHSVFVNIV